MTTITNMGMYQAIVIASALELYAKTRIQANRAYTPMAMLRKANEITGGNYKRGQYLLAAVALRAWCDQRQREGESLQTERDMI